jgi:hypothetical protein
MSFVVLLTQLLELAQFTQTKTCVFLLPERAQDLLFLRHSAALLWLPRDHTSSPSLNLCPAYFPGFWVKASRSGVATCARTMFPDAYWRGYAQ